MLLDNKKKIHHYIYTFEIKCIAGWSSLVARWAHNPKVAGSNPAPATKSNMILKSSLKAYFFIIISLFFNQSQSNPYLGLSGLSLFHVCSIVALQKTQTKHHNAFLAILYSFLAIYRAANFYKTDYPKLFPEQLLKKLSLIHIGLCSTYAATYTYRCFTN